MIARIVVVPGAPLLLPEYAGRVDAGAALRSRCVEVAMETLRGDGTGGPASVAIVSATDRDARSTKVPLGLRIGAEVLRQAGFESWQEVVVPWDAPTGRCAALAGDLGGATDLLVVADGSARRSEKAPGHLDERAFTVDDELVAALRAADPQRLLGLDPDLAAEVMAHSRAALQVAAAAMGGEAGAAGGDTAYRTTTLEVSDPFGVLYVVAALVSARRSPG